MDKKKLSHGVKRRTFLQTGAMLTASTLFLPLGGYKVFGASNHNQKKNAVPTVTLNNGIPMPMLGFGTHSPKGCYLCTMCF